MLDLIDLYIDTSHYLHDDIYNNLWTTSVNNNTNLADLAINQFYYPIGFGSIDRFQVNTQTGANDVLSYKKGWIYLKNNNMPIRESYWLDRFEFTLNLRIFDLQPGVILHAGYDPSNPIDYCFYLYADSLQTNPNNFNLGIWSKDRQYGAALNITNLYVDPIYAQGYAWMNIKVIGDGQKITLSIVEYPEYGVAQIPFSMYNVKGGINIGQDPNNSSALGCSARFNSLKLKGSYYGNKLKVY